MIKVATALRTVLKGIKILDSEVIKLTDALGRVLAQDLYADYNIPQFDNSAMDGYVLKSSNTRGASSDKPKILEVIEDVKAGDITKKILKNNQAIRIMTGAPIPKGADSVIMVEDTQRCIIDKVNPVRSGAPRRGTSNGVKIFIETEIGKNIRKAGEDIKKGELVIPCGRLLKSAHIGLLASFGIAKVRVIRKPKVAILATGDELVAFGKRLTRGKIRSSNTYTLFSQVLKCGGIPKNLGIAKDSPGQLERKIMQGLDCDIILTSGGVSVGDYDLVKEALAKLGTNIKFWKVAMRPGKPLAFGTISAKGARLPPACRPGKDGQGFASSGKDKLVFGLPGNPVSSMISFEVFVRPAILNMMGQKHEERKEVDAVLEEGITKKKGLRYFLRAYTYWKDGVYLTRTTGSQGSAILKSMAAANSLIILPEEEEKIEKGVRVTVRFLD